MLFNSYEFIFLFLPISFFVYFFLNKKGLITASKAWLILASLFFYSWWNVIYLPLIVTSVVSNYLITNSIMESDKKKHKTLSKKTLFRFGLIFNIGLLCYFKYMDFFIENVNDVLSTQFDLLHLAGKEIVVEEIGDRILFLPVPFVNLLGTVRPAQGLFDDMSTD